MLYSRLFSSKFILATHNFPFPATHLFFPFYVLENIMLISLGYPRFATLLATTDTEKFRHRVPQDHSETESLTARYPKNELSDFPSTHDYFHIIKFTRANSMYIYRFNCVSFLLLLHYLLTRTLIVKCATPSSSLRTKPCRHENHSRS